MSGTDPIKQQPDEALSEQARRGLRQAEVGDTDGTDQLNEVQATDAEAVEVAEQAASDGPEGLGLAR